MQRQSMNTDPVSRVISECHRSEAIASRLFHQIAEEHQRHIVMGDTTVDLDETQADDFVHRFSSEVEPEYWTSRRRKD